MSMLEEDGSKKIPEVPVKDDESTGNSALESAPKQKPRWVYFLVSFICCVIAGAVAYAAGSEDKDGFSAPVGCAIIAIGIQWVAWVPASIYQTEKFYDLVGSITYISIASFSLFYTQEYTPRHLVTTCLVYMWALRLGSFLFRRIRSDGKDTRFNFIKTNPVRFLNAWTIQGLWVLLTSLSVIVINSSKEDPDLSYSESIGWSIWAIGFGIEVVSDHQKTVFRSDPANKGKWICTGLWRYSRHPNYFGEIILWLGIFISGTQIYKNGNWICVLSPVFVYLLISKVSGIPLLEKQADTKWKDNVDYRKYRASTSVLCLWPVNTYPFCTSVSEGEDPLV